jgi:hypothetical protein
MNDATDWGWSAATAYAVGLIATDGCIDGRRPIVSFTSRDLELIEQFNLAVGRRPRVYRKLGGFGTWTNQVAIYERPLHSWLLSIGLMPRKTFELFEIAVPDQHLAPLARGLLDGDGSVLSYWHVPNRRRYPQHRSLRLVTRFYSASRRHLEWLAQRLDRAFSVRGAISVDDRATRAHPLYKLEFAKLASRQLLTRLYADEHAPHLRRKYDVWRRFLADESAVVLHAEVLLVDRVPEEGVEPSRAYAQRILSPSRAAISPLRRASILRLPPPQ